MRLIHLSDLHIGKRINGYSQIEDQRFILKQILKIVDDIKPNGVMIAGDVYDKSIPTTEAVGLLDDFVYELSSKGCKVLMIAGNHDSVERLSFASRLMELGGVFVSRVYDGRIDPIVLTDGNGPVNIYLMPFVKPIHVRKVYEDAVIENYSDMMRVAIDAMNIDDSQRNVLVAHQFVTGAERSDSEEKSVGGLDNVDAEVFKIFDYVALGHIHGPQNIGSDKVRYCGTPLKYSISEATHEKSVTVIELGQKGEMQVQTIRLKPLRDMRKVCGMFDDVIASGLADSIAARDYVHVVLNDEDEIPGAFDALRKVYPYILGMEYDNTRTRNTAAVTMAEDVDKKSELQLFAELFEMQNGRIMNGEEREYMSNLIENLKEGR